MTSQAETEETRLTKMPSDAEIQKMIADRLAQAGPARSSGSRRLDVKMGASRARAWIERQRAADERCCDEQRED